MAIAALTVLAPGGAGRSPRRDRRSPRCAPRAPPKFRMLFVRTPLGDNGGKPLQVLIALHGMGGNGADFAAALAGQADARGWLIVAPTIGYGDWTDPAQITREERLWWRGYPTTCATCLSALASTFSREFYSLDTRVGTARVALHRDESRRSGWRRRRVGGHVHAAVFARRPHGPHSAISLRHCRPGNEQRRPGVRRARVRIGAGMDRRRGADSNAADVPDAWNPYIGNDRLDRARSFTTALQNLGADVALTVFANTDHTLTDEMRAAGCAALAAAAA